MSAALTVTPPPRRVPAYERHDPSRVVGRMSAEEYAVFERAATERHEFVHGKVVRMAGGSPEHNLIGLNTLRVLGNALEAAALDCDAYGSDQKVYVAEDLFYYPDGCIVCGAAQVDHRDALRNPLVLIEVLSESTDKDDRTDKFRHYRRIPTLRHYVLIDQYRVAVTHYAKQPDGKWAIAGEYRSLSDTMTLDLGGATVSAPLSAIYRRVFPAREAADAQEADGDVAQ